MNNKGNTILNIIATPYFVPKGSSLRVDSILEKLSKENIVDVLTYPIGENPDYENVKFHRVMENKNFDVGISEISMKVIILDFFLLIRAFTMMMRKDYNIIHCEDFEAAFIGSVLSIFFPNRRYVYDMHNTIEDNLRITGKPKAFIKIAKIISRFVYSRFDTIIANWKLYMNIDKDKQFLLYDKSNIGIEKIKIPTGNRFLTYSGNYKEYQGVEHFLEVYAKSNVDYDLILIGKISERIMQLIDELDINGKVHCMGLLDIKKSNYVLSKSEYCLIPRISGDQPGLKMIHHLMLGKPSLATDIPANTEILKNGYNSVLYSTEEELVGILKNIETENGCPPKIQKGIEESQKDIQKIWSEKYFNDNYFRTYGE